MFSRRSALAVMGSALAALGLGSPAEAAGKTYKVCKAAAIPVKGGKSFVVAGRNILITQIKSGSFKAFDATCTHAGCPVSQITSTALVCVCHGAKFSPTTGAVLAGPAQAPLSKITVKLVAGTVTVVF